MTTTFNYTRLALETAYKHGYAIGLESITPWLDIRLHNPFNKEEQKAMWMAWRDGFNEAAYYCSKHR